MGLIGELFNQIFTYPIFNGLMLLYHLFGDLGLSIIILTLVIKLVLFPLTLQQLKSMKATQALQPQMAEIRKKYAKDQQAQATAMQALYKEYGFNPLAGCLPLLIQLPVLYGLFYALRTVVSIKNLHEINAILYPFVQPFAKLPNIDLNWFTFINYNFHFSLASPDPTHILPILAGVATFVQLRMSQPKTAATANASDPSTQSMKTMQYIMPLITVFFGWTFPAGLALYWTVSSVFQAVQQYFITGWGSLREMPDFLVNMLPKQEGSNHNGKSVTTTRSNGSNGYNKELARQQQVQGSQNEELAVSNAAIASRTKTTPRANGSTSTRRRQSSSGRRRSSNQKRRSSRN
ncbi:MAG: membrane protein insertase YidC [Ktedonobacteraceae bacterium]|nr:membrane protein insertase YidC [Ktedonobacteraceae bacterium]